jgi:hypothetical protein
MQKVENDYKEFLRLLNKHKAKYCVVGAYAVAFYATPRYTKDIDVFVDQTRDNAKKVLAALHEFGFKQLNLTEDDLMQENSIIQLGYEPVRIDLVTAIDGCSFGDVWKNRKIGRYGSERVFFISLKDLIRNKKSSNRKQDQVDVEILRKVGK